MNMTYQEVPLLNSMDNEEFKDEPVIFFLLSACDVSKVILFEPKEGENRAQKFVNQLNDLQDNFFVKPNELFTLWAYYW